MENYEEYKEKMGFCNSCLSSSKEGCKDRRKEIYPTFPNFNLDTNFGIDSVCLFWNSKIQYCEKHGFYIQGPHPVSACPICDDYFITKMIEDLKD